MSHKAFTVSGPQLPGAGWRAEIDEETSRRIQETAREIATTYDEIEEQGGEVVGDHLFPGELDSGRGTMSNYVLYLVARFSDE